MAYVKMRLTQPIRVEDLDGDLAVPKNAMNTTAGFWFWFKGPYIIQTLDFLNGARSPGPVKQGDRWKRKMTFRSPVDTTWNVETLEDGVPVEFSFRYDGIHRLPGGQERALKISYEAEIELDKALPVEKESGKASMKTQGKVTGALYYDPRKRMFTRHERSLQTASEEREERRIEFDDLPIREKSSKDAKLEATLEWRLVSIEPPVGPADQPEGDAAEDLIAERVWTNLEGRRLTAALIRFEEGKGTFRRPDGSVFEYPITKLSESDRKTLEENLREDEGDE